MGSGGVRRSELCPQALDDEVDPALELGVVVAGDDVCCNLAHAWEARWVDGADVKPRRVFGVGLQREAPMEVVVRPEW